jgi:hypothetical protein
MGEQVPLQFAVKVPVAVHASAWTPPETQPPVNTKMDHFVPLCEALHVTTGQSVPVCKGPLPRRCYHLAEKRTGRCRIHPAHYGNQIAFWIDPDDVATSAERKHAVF